MDGESDNLSFQPEEERKWGTMFKCLIMRRRRSRRRRRGRDGGDDYDADDKAVVGVLL